MEIVLDGESFKCRTKAVDHTTAEVMSAKDGGTMETRPAAHGFRVAYAVFRRCNPESDYAHSFARFMDALDEMRDLEAGPDEPDPLDPTHPADGDDWP
jgi:hypothetical protein